MTQANLDVRRPHRTKRGLFLTLRLKSLQNILRYRCTFVEETNRLSCTNCKWYKVTKELVFNLFLISTGCYHMQNGMSMRSYGLRMRSFLKICKNSLGKGVHQFIYLTIDYANTICILNISTPYFHTILAILLKKIILISVDLSKSCWMSDKECRPWSDAASRGVWSGSTLFAQTCLTKYFG